MGLKAEIDEAIEGISGILGSDLDHKDWKVQQQTQIENTLIGSKEFLDKTKEVLTKILTTNKVDKFEIEKLLMVLG